MTAEQLPAEKAKELIEKYSNILYESNGTGAGATYCAIQSCQDIIEELRRHPDHEERIHFIEQVIEKINK